MELMERHYSVLLVSASEKLNQSLTGLLSEAGYSPVCIVADTGSAKRQLLERRFDIIVINTPLPDDFGTRFAIDLCSESSAGVLLLVRSELFSDITAKVMPYGALTLSKPTSAQMLSQCFLLLCATRERLRRIERKTASIEEKMEEIRIVNHAKWLLIERLGMTEKDAHHYIEKQAMDRCATKRSIAETIIATYK